MMVVDSVVEFEIDQLHEDLEVVKLARRRIDTKLAALLIPHKVALLAIEKQSALLMKERIEAAPNDDVRIKAARIILKASYQTSAKLAYNHAVKEFKMLGVEGFPAKMPKLDFSYNEALMLPLKTSLAALTLTPDEKARRAALGASSAANRAYTDMQLAMYAAIADRYEVQKVWVANLNAATPPCQFCMRLHNQAVAIDKPFPIPRGSQPFTDLHGPPCHGNCRCRLVIRALSEKAA